MIDDFDGVEVCYSIGVGPDVSWDLDMAARGCLVHQYDHTVDAPPSRHDRFRFHRIGVAADDHISPDLKRLDTLITANGHAGRRDMILKMDIEGSEWDVLAAVNTATLSAFRQIVCELHALHLMDQPSFRKRARSAFRNLRSGHRIVHVHGNNYSNIHYVNGIAIPDVIEVTLASREIYDFSETSEIFPTALDAPCNPNIPEMFLGSFRFQ